MAANRQTQILQRGDRAAGAILALLLQAGLFALLLSSRPTLAPPPQLVRELTLILPRLRKLPPPSPERPRQQPVPSFQAPMPLVPLPPNPTTPAATPPDISKLGQSIFGCAPENYASLTPSQRALCSRPGDGVAVQQVPNLMGSHSQVKDPAYWEAQLAGKKSAPWIPCTGPAFKPTLADIGFSPLCLLDKASEGTLSDPRTWPRYQVEQLSPQDFYKIEQAYDAWHKAHGGR